MSSIRLTSITCLALFAFLQAAPAVNAQSDAPAAHPEFDWSIWKRIPVLDDGRIKPIDSVADEFVALVCGRSLLGSSVWKDPETGVTYDAAELLYAWIADPSAWAGRQMVRCEFRPLRKMLSEGGRDIPEAGKFVSVDDVLDWDVWKKEGRLKFRSDEVTTRFGKFGGKSADKIGDTKDDRELNGKLGELMRHIEVFMFAADRIAVLPGLDPRILSKQTDPDAQLPAWMPLASLLRLDDWRKEQRADFSIVALMADSPRDLLEHEAAYWNLPSERMGQYPPENIVQLAQAQEFKGELEPTLREAKDAFDATRTAYQQGDAAEFASTMQIFERKLRAAGESLQAARTRMVPPVANSFDFGDEELNTQIWKRFVPLELDERQMSFSAYPDAGSTHVELVYNESRPFSKAWMVFLLAVLTVCMSMIVRASRTAYLAGVAIGIGAVLYATWGFALRILIAGRPPVTNMYETVIWVSYVVALLGMWFAMLPVIWPGVHWSWRLAGLPVRFRRNETGRISGVEADDLRADEQDRLFANFKRPIQILASLLRLSGFVGLLWFLTSSNTTFQIIDLVPPLFTDAFGSTPSFGRFATWCVGMAAVLAAAWYVPRVVLTILGSVILVVPEGLRERRDRGDHIWEQILARRFFVVPALTVACFGMMLAHFVGVSSPNILDPNIGSIAAVLRNNYWLAIHVLTIVSSYGAGALAWGIGNMAMLYYLFGKYRSKDASQPVLASASSAKAAGSISDTGLDYVDEDYGKSTDGILARMRRVGSALKPGTIGSTLKSGFQGGGDVHLEHSSARPPKEVSTLANYAYKVMQVAVLLLAAGTILGGLWADVSWGRFWDWDPKEVWALISLLVYLVVLHGRFAGWVGTFGTSAGSVLCFNAILMSWYGVNFILPKVHGWLNGTGVPTSVGLHSYATGDSAGLGWIVSAVVLNLVLVMAAWARYATETIEPSQPTGHA